ncbi:hypothetical protein BDY19DRAFT_456025 [Irpex rosettiformis]|uniref:Uncharacterized protein n=1 Tax=Irpex rosettiformis TaxID=378272 RepID=A0ACB8TTE2_9APHY|nr:hypothetical protein BDY19DRAFT_456025 [Irpex rosettiformis]
MRFSTFAVALATVFVGVQAYNPIGQLCGPEDSQGSEGCSSDASLNGGNAFIYECGPTNTFVYLAGCRCPTCCEVSSSQAFCT